MAMYWLLDESAEVRLGAADGFRERAVRGIVDPQLDAGGCRAYPIIDQQAQRFSASTGPISSR